MAIDSREKRQSLTGTHLYAAGPGVTPNSGTDQEWRQEVGYGYPGILASGAGPSAVLVAQARSVARFTQGRVFGRVN